MTQGTEAYESGLAAAQSDAFRMAGIFLALPAANVAEGVRSGAVAEDMRALAREAKDEGRLLEAAALLDETASGGKETAETTLRGLRRDYTALFSNPEHPAVNVYEAGFKEADDFDYSRLTFISPTALDAERQYKAWGLAVGREPYESPDHMGAELDFLSFLWLQVAEALADGDEEGAARARAAIAEFRRTHFDKWAKPFFEQVYEAASTDAYRAVGLLGQYLADCC